MRELGYIPIRDEAGRVWPIVVTNEPLPETRRSEFAVVQPFPVVETSGDELVRAPREYRTLTQHPEPIQVAA